MFLVIYVLNDETNIVVNVIVRANIVIYLNKFPISLGQIHTAVLNNCQVVIVRFSFKECFDIGKYSEV